MFHIPLIDFLMFISGRKYRVLKTWDLSDINTLNKNNIIINCPYCGNSISDFVYREIIDRPDSIGLYDENKSRINYIYGNNLPPYIPRKLRKAIGKNSLQLVCDHSFVDYRRCLNCDLVFQNFPHSSESKKFYYQVLYRINTEKEDSTGTKIFGKANKPKFVRKKDLISRFFIDRTRLPMGTKILDVGCGEGLICRYLTERGFEAYGIEPSISMVNYARQILHLDHITCGEYSKESYPQQYFDGIISHHVLEHIVDIDAFFSALNDHLKVGGFLLIQVPFVDSIGNLEDYRKRIFASGHLRGYSEKFLQRIHRKFNFEILECKKTPCDLSRLPKSDVDIISDRPLWGDGKCGISILSKKTS